MPPHCDSLDGPVVTAAHEALVRGDVALLLPYVHADGEAEVCEAFALAANVRALGGEAQEVAERWLFETAVRVHRQGEGAPFTGLKPAGLDVGPVIPAARCALELEDADELIAVLSSTVSEQVKHRLRHALDLKPRAGEGVAAARRYVEAMLGFQVWAHGVYEAALRGPHERPEGHAH